MALISQLLNEVIDQLHHPHGDIFDQNFAVDLIDEDFLQPALSLLGTSLRSGYIRPWRRSDPSASGVSSIHCDDKEFRVSLDVQQFKPDEVKVKVVDGFAVVDGKHEERSDEHGFVSRQFTRRYRFPKDVDVAQLSSTLSSDGVLTLTAPKRALPPVQTKEIPITLTNSATKEEPKKSH